MKRINQALAMCILAWTGVVSCQQEVVSNDLLFSKDGVKAIVPMPVCGDAALTKGIFVDNDKSTIDFAWIEGTDKISVYTNEDGEAMTYAVGEVTSADQLSCQFLVKNFTLTEGNTYYAFYPNNGETSANAQPVDYTTQTQIGLANGLHLANVSYMYSGAAQNGSFAFNHVSSWLSIKIKSATDINIGKVVLCTSTAEAFLAKGTVDARYGVVTPTEKTSRINLFLSDASLNAGESGYVYLAVRNLKHLEDFSIKVYDTNGNFAFEKSFVVPEGSDPTFTPGMYYTISFKPGLGYKGEILPEAPVVIGNTVNVNAANAQYTLDGAYGPIDGKTINFTESIEEKLVIGRPNKFAGSKTVYRHGSHSSNPMSYDAFIEYKTQPGWTEGCYYSRAISNVTFTSEQDVTLSGFVAEAGDHVYGSSSNPIYDYVRDNNTLCYDTNNGYFVYADLSNFKFDGLTFTGKTDIATSANNTVIDGFWFNNCSFDINNTDPGNQGIRYYNEGNASVRNLKVTGCVFNSAYQPVYTAHVENIDIENCTVETTGHNAFAIQNASFGEFIIKNNTITGCGDRAIRFLDILDGTSVTIVGNNAKYGDGVTPSTEEAIKANSIAAGVTTDVHGNNWNNFKEPYNPELRDPAISIGSKGYSTLSDAFTAVKDGETIEIHAAGEYSVETIPGKTGVSFNIEATVEDVVFNHTTAATSWVAASGALRTVKNITLNVGDAHHQYASNINFENCKIIGLLCSHVQNTFTDCDFVCETGYNMWAYGSPCTFVRCSFKCSGTNGGAINAYNEGKQDTTTALVFTDCEFEALNQSNKYAAVYIKPETGFDVTFTNCTANEYFKPGDKSNGSRLWNVKDNTNKDHKVTVNDVVVYENGQLK